MCDVCCGTGTIGILLARGAAGVVGVDICGPAVADAAANATTNGITNARFVAGSAESVMGDVLKFAPGADGKRQRVVAVVDPPRPGLHASVISCVGQCDVM